MGDNSMNIPRAESSLGFGFFLVQHMTLLFIFGMGAASAAPPIPASCDESTFHDKGDRLKCHFDNVAAQQTTTADMISEMDEIPMNQKQAMKNTAMRGKKAQTRAQGNDYKQLSKKAAVQCQISEIIGDSKGDDDGVCTSGEDCSEELGDGIGNEDGICKPLNGKNREVCVQICDAEGIDDNPDNFDNAAGDTISDDLIDQLGDSTQQYAELNTELETMTTAKESIQAAADSGDCSAIFDARVSFEAGLIASQAAVTLRGVAGQFSKVCGQDAAGFNTNTACIVTETIAAMAEIVDDSLEYLTAAIDSDTMDATYGCVKEVKASVGETNEVLADIQYELVNVNKRLDIVQQQLDQANQNLLTPQGQREGFNN